jgi:uncharacterized protein (DUF302 family)
MLQTRSAVRLEDIETVVKAAAQRHNCSVLVVSHLAAGARDAFVFTVCHSKLYTALLTADIRFTGYLPCRIAAWPEDGGVTLMSVTPSEYGRLFGRADLESVAAPLEELLRHIMEDAGRPLVATAHSRPGASDSMWAATEDMVNMRLALPQRIDCRGTKLEDEGGTGKHDAPGG